MKPAQVQDPTHKKILLTSLSAMVAESTTFPIDITKTRLQLHASSTTASASASAATNAFKVAINIVRNEGFLGLYQGLSPAIIHHMTKFHSPTDFSNLPNKPKKRRWFARVKALKFSFGRLFGRDKNKAWKYENVESRDRGNKYRTSPYLRRDRDRGRCSKISKKFSHVLKQFACGNKCSKGFDRYEDQYRDLHNTS